jgi:reactive intermediate/imine deaminase
MSKQIIQVRDGLKSPNPLSAAIRAGDYIFISGRTGTTDEQGVAVTGIEAQTRQCFEYMKEVLQAAGADLCDVVKVNVLLVNEADFPIMNEVYRGYWPDEPPARTTAVTGLARPNALVEIECIAYSPLNGRRANGGDSAPEEAGRNTSGPRSGNALQ